MRESKVAAAVKQNKLHFVATNVISGQCAPTRWWTSISLQSFYVQSCRQPANGQLCRLRQDNCGISKEQLKEECPNTLEGGGISKESGHFCCVAAAAAATHIGLFSISIKSTSFFFPLCCILKLRCANAHWEWSISKVFPQLAQGCKMSNLLHGQKFEFKILPKQRVICD